MTNSLYLIEIAIEPKTRGEAERMGLALTKLAAEDLSFGVSVDHESGQTQIRGVSESHLAAKLETMRRDFQVDARVGPPQVAYRETINLTSEVDYTYKKLMGTSGEFARVKLRFEPLPPGSGFEFISRADAGNVPLRFVPGVEQGIRNSLETGVLAGFPMIDFRAILLDGVYHDLDSSVRAFELAARAAFKDGIMKAEPTLLEPVVRVDIVTREDCAGEIVADLNLRRGQVTGSDPRGDARDIDALVPLANLFGYAAALASLSRGHATFTMRFSHYARIPPSRPDDDRPFPPAVGMRA